MYTITRHEYSAPVHRYTLDIRKDGQLILSKGTSLFGDGEYVHYYPVYAFTAPNILTREQGYRYWRKHFPNRTCYAIPEVLERATALDPGQVLVCPRNAPLYAYPEEW